MKQTLLESSNDITRGLYQGYVIDNDDPEKAGRVKVAVDSMTEINLPIAHEETQSTLSEEDLAWYPVLASANATNNANLSTMDIGARVLVQFPDGDIYNGLVVFSSPDIPPA